MIFWVEFFPCGFSGTCGGITRAVFLILVSLSFGFSWFSLLFSFTASLNCLKSSWSCLCSDLNCWLICFSCILHWSMIFFLSAGFVASFAFSRQSLIVFFARSSCCLNASRIWCMKLEICWPGFVPFEKPNVRLVPFGNVTVKLVALENPKCIFVLLSFSLSLSSLGFVLF